MGLGEKLMKIVVRVTDVVELARRFRAEPLATMGEVMQQVRTAVVETLEQVMNAEIDLVLGEEKDPANKCNSHTLRTYGIKGVGEVSIKVPRDRKGGFKSAVVPPSRRYDEALERDIGMLCLAGLSTRTLALLGRRVLGVRVSAQEVSNSMHALVPAAKRFLELPLGDRRWVFLYVDGTFFSVRRTTVEKKLTLVVLGVDDQGYKSVLAMVQGDKDCATTWTTVFEGLTGRGLDASAVVFGVMDGLAGLAMAFRVVFPTAQVGQCWVHMARNVTVRVPQWYQAAFKAAWDGAPTRRRRGRQGGPGGPQEAVRGDLPGGRGLH